MALNRRRILHGASMGGLLLAAIGCGDDAAPAKPGDASKPGANAEVNSATGKGTPTVAAFTGAPLEIKASDKELLEAAKPEGKVQVEYLRGSERKQVQLPLSKRATELKSWSIPFLAKWKRDTERTVFSAFLSLIRYEATPAAWSLTLLWLIDFNGGDADRLQEVE